MTVSTGFLAPLGQVLLSACSRKSRIRSVNRASLFANLEQAAAVLALVVVASSFAEAQEAEAEADDVAIEDASLLTGRFAERV